jgi:hypothetical protein
VIELCAVSGPLSAPHVLAFVARQLQGRQGDARSLAETKTAVLAAVAGFRRQDDATLVAESVDVAAAVATAAVEANATARGGAAAWEKTRMPIELPRPSDADDGGDVNRPTEQETSLGGP